MLFRTRVSFEGIFKIDGGMCFKAQNGTGFKLNSLHSGIACIEPLGATNIEDFVTVVVGCFDEKSNLYGFRAIEFDFDGVHIVVDSRNMDYETIVKEWYNKRKVKFGRCQIVDE